ncbi:MAG: Ig-like domain repeat protein [Bryobacteraceae bacterium]
MRYNTLFCFIFLLIAIPFKTFAQAVPSITNVTNAAIPDIDQPPASVHLKPRSMATLFGRDLADSAVSIAPPWRSILAGTEVHLVIDQITYGIDGGTNFTAACQVNCDITADLVYASPTQINFVLPDGLIVGNSRTIERSRIVLIRDGVRFDNLFNIISGVGIVYIDPLNGDPINAAFVVFIAGYDCLFSFSITDPSACGLSPLSGPHRGPLGSVTDSEGHLLTHTNPVHQGQPIVLWSTGLGSLVLDPKTGLLHQVNPDPVGFGVAQNGTAIPSTISSGFGGFFGTFMSAPPTFAGESPEFVGLNQINISFPVCPDSTTAKTEARYDAFLVFQSIVSGNPAIAYLPFIVRPGDPDCKWAISTTTTLSASVNPSVSGQPVTFNASVSPAAATGTVTFLDGGVIIGSSTLISGLASLTTSTLSVGGHSITASYSGDATYAPSSAMRSQTVKGSTNTTVASNANPLTPGQSLVLTAMVSPAGATGTVAFFDGTQVLGNVTVQNGLAMCGVSSSCVTLNLIAGSHLIKAIYSGDSNYGNSTGTLTQVIIGASSVTLMSNANPATLGQVVMLTATVSPCCVATGTVTFFDGNNAIGSGPLAPINGALRATASTSSLSVGSHSLSAHYSGDSRYTANTSAALTETIWIITISSNPNPSSYGQFVTLTVCGIPSGAMGTVTFLDGSTFIASIGYVTSPCSSYSTNSLAVGAHLITARYRDDFGGDTSAMLTQTVKGNSATASSLNAGSGRGK